MYAPDIDRYRDEAARCCAETARYERGERPPLRLDPNDLDHNEFSDSAAGIAGEVAMKVGRAIIAVGARFDPAMAWDVAAQLLRSGYQRGDKLASLSLLGRGASS